MRRTLGWRWLAAIMLLALIGFAGLTWVSIAALNLEAEQHRAAAKAERDDQIRLALWRLDSYLLPELSIENNRPYDHYAQADSPLNIGSYPDWIRLYVEYDSTTGWRSPRQRDSADLNRLRTHFQGPDIAGQLAVTEPKKSSVGIADGLPTLPLSMSSYTTTQAPIKELESATISQLMIVEESSTPEFQARYKTTQRTLVNHYGNDAMAKVQGDSVNTLMTDGRLPSLPIIVPQQFLPSGWLPGNRDERQPIPHSIQVGPMQPRWLINKDGKARMFLLRSARIDERSIYQGILLDWPRLQQQLLKQVADLFPKARLKPLLKTDKVNPERTMTALPIELDPGPMPTPPLIGWTTLRSGLLLAWLAAVVTLISLTLGARAMLAYTDRRIRFVSAVTHELRTPMTTFQLYLDLLESGIVSDPAKQKEYIATLQNESTRLNRLIDNVLDFARLETPIDKPQPQPIRIGDWLNEVEQTWANRCRDNGMSLVIDSEIDPATTVVITCAIVMQIVGNLIDNARKYAQSASDKRIRLRVAQQTNRLILEVEDAGPGVASHDQDGLFRPFHRGEVADTIAGGVGLGLSLAQEWTRRIGGTLRHHLPASGQGACFRLTLPCHWPANDS